jgi:hypothetical protein
MNKFFWIFISSLFLFCVQLNAQCSGTYSTSNATCQQFTVGNGTPGAIVLCLTANNIPGGGGTSCNPGGTCGSNYNGGGWSARIAIYTTTGSLVTTWNSTTPAGTCYTISTTNGYAVIYGLCLTAGTTISWNTVNLCGASVCSGTVPCTGQPCSSCTSACAACGFTSTPSVATVTSSCPATNLSVPFGSGQAYSMCATFTAAATTVTFNVIIQSNCSGGNVSNFAWTLQNSTCGGILQSGSLSSLTFTNLTIGAVYVYCYSFSVPVSPYCQHTIHWPYFVGAVPLPIELISFRAANENRKVVLNWSTGSEKNSSYFAVERSPDALNFEEIAQVKAAGSSAKRLNYTYSDDQPLSGTAYYRLKQADADGSFKYSSIEAVNYTGALAANDFQLVPNPATSEVNVNFVCGASSSEFIHLYDQFGQLLLSQEVSCVTGANSARLNILGLKSGLYYVMMNTRDKAYRSKLVIR